ncbi:hypothetical protein Mapa_003763 [Marchantia paleacea]|nr:hypothetical protein Mapa_003763 [Marchantia paleacea]
MLDPLCRSLVVKFDHAAGLGNSSRRCNSEFLLRLRECRSLSCSSRGVRKLLYRCSSSQKYGSACSSSSLGKNVRKLSRLKSVPLCTALFGEFNRNAVGSSTTRETADGGTGLNDVDSSSPSPSPPPPSHALHTSRSISEERHGDRRAFDHANTVGILGGLNPLATVEFMRKIVDASNAEDESDHIPVLLCSDPNLRKRIASSRGPMKSSFKPALLEDAYGGAEEEIELITVEPLIQKRRFLEESGAKCIVMPCHVSHLWYDQLAEGCTVPFLHMADCVIDELKAADLQPLEAGTRPKIGVLGSEATLASAFYQEKLRSQGFDVALPDKATMEHAVIPGIAALQRRDMEGAKNLLRIAVQVLLVNAVNMVVLACHNMPTAFDADDPVLRKCIDPTHALARAAVKWSKTTKGLAR